MNKAIMITGLLVLLTCVGCAAVGRAVDAIAPSQTDAQGNRLPGTHQATPMTADTAGMIPYGSFALNGLLLIVNFIEKVKANKVKKGLVATVQAIEQAGKDPAIKEAIVGLKKDLSDAHDIAGVQPVMKDILARI